jgi:protein TorT
MKKLLLSRPLVAGALLCIAAFRQAWWTDSPPGAQPLSGAHELVSISGFYGTYDAETEEPGRPARSLRGSKQETWRWDRFQSTPRPYRLGVLFPNREESDVYWRAVRNGIEQQGHLSGVELKLLSSMDYTHVEQHQKQFQELAGSGVDGIILGSIHYRAMDLLVKRAASGEFGKSIPVVAIINDVHAPAISAKVMVSFFDMGRQAGAFVRADALAAHKSKLTIAFLPGPLNSGWAPESLRGVLDAIRDYPGELHIIPPQWGSPDQNTQRALVESLLEQHQSIDYIVGNAVAASEAVPLLRALGRANEVRVISTYSNSDVEREIKAGGIAAAPSDETEALGRLAVGTMIRILNGEKPGVDLPFQIATHIQMKTVQTAAGDSPP